MVIFLISYLIGSIPFGLILTKMNGIDVKKVGSGNIGATNVLRTGSKKMAIATLFLDSLKGFIAVYATQNICNDHTSLAAIAVILGHMFPVWLEFKGGKGIATTIGVLLAINLYVSTIFICTWAIVFITSRYSSLSSLIAVLVSTMASLFYFKNALVALIVATPLIIIRHHENIIRLMKREEHKFCAKKVN
ncbi:glycerol-3-phosphate 1-O-acyltransferase PlsY [Candidatus Mesenet endosymbiont of Agriotes lineatus]|uniref:glycerol-3-phosphate 1-O-acyltransferase PlsY n=1 Tax=Candidatus Mesenet endosymbiont of Agriotes lineatus TaxID=3077948 RepID=UPI0030D1E9BA